MLFRCVFLSLLLTVVSCTELSSDRVDEQIDELTGLPIRLVRYLATADVEELPDEIQREVRKAGDSSHWCCQKDTTQIVVETKGVQKYHQVTHRQKRYKKCGTWGWSRCTTFRVHYSQATAYGIQYSSKVIRTECPNSMVVCCKGFILVAEQCIELSLVYKHKNDLLRLSQLGAI
ncbi:uncharacterized protein LOC141900185 [Tubulanus polymorphus]|uniref:uncharacterized protein LOC141900185 n=1 Tax=Tubulanus polymorphus TaxID=672921 RepID=UPI003DA2B672